MNILYVTQYFYPEVGATTNRALANIRHLARNNEVTVLTEMPNHPKGVIFEGYKGKIFMSEKMENFLVKRVWVWSSKKKVFYTRILFYLTFAGFGALFTLFNARRYDLVYLTSPPLFSALIGIIAKFFYPRKKLFFEVRDLWPDAAIEMGELKNKALISLSYRIEKSIYKHSEKIITVTRKAKEQLIERGISYHKIEVIPNGVSPEIAAKKVDYTPAEMQQNKDCFIVLYAGILGLAQNLHVLLKAASLLEKENICFVIAGTGPKEQELKKEAAGQQNVTFTGEIERGKIHNYLQSADCGVIPLAKLDVFKKTVPSKLFEYMACGLPVLLGVEGEAAEILLDADAGITFTPDNARELAANIKQLRDNPLKMKNFAVNGREYVLEHFNRQKHAERLENILKDAVSES